jgi:O-methyltransferase involved in polyketide biosynthesis
VESAFTRLTPVQESLFLTLYLRALDHRSPDPILRDALSDEVARKIGYDFGRLKVVPSQVLDLALRTKRLDELVQEFVAGHPDAVVLDLGCGLDPRAIRCDLPPGTDWFDLDFPEVLRIRERYLPLASHQVGADLTGPDWLDGIPADRPAMVVADGLMAFLTGERFRAMARTLTGHFPSGEFAFNAYTPFDLWAANYSGTFRSLHTKTAGEGFTDPHVPEGWGARLTLAEELLLTRAPEIAKYPRPLRDLTRLCAHSTWISRHGNRIVRYRF